MRDSFVFYKSFAEAIQNLSKSDRLRIYDGIVIYALYGEEPQLTGAAAGMFSLIKPQLDANNRKYENGKRGGRPARSEQVENDNQTETKEEPNDNQTETKPKPNVNVNVNVNENVNENVNVSTDVDVWAASRSVLSYLNQLTGSNWRVDAADHVRMISELIHKGYNEDQMRDVIDKKADEWLGDPKMERYLRPSTLFKPDNFVKYLDAPDSARKKAKVEQERKESEAVAKRDRINADLNANREKLAALEAEYKSASVQKRIDLRFDIDLLRDKIEKQQKEVLRL